MQTAMSLHFRCRSSARRGCLSAARWRLSGTAMSAQLPILASIGERREGAKQKRGMLRASGIPFPAERILGSRQQLFLSLKRTSFLGTSSQGSFFAFGFTRSAEPEALDYIRMVVLLFSISMDPIIRADLRLHYQLVALSCVPCNCLA